VELVVMHNASMAGVVPRNQAPRLPSVLHYLGR
jgi:hypothetical protein